MTQSYLTQLYTNTLSNQNISSALNTGTYTEPGTRLRKLFITLFADQIAGNGNYTAYVTRQIAGAGSAYEVGQRTIVAVPSGVTAQAFQTIAVLCGVSDVIKTYIVGLGGDTTTPDIITNVVEEFVGVGADGNALISTDTQDLSSTLSVNTKKVNGTTQTARDLGLALPAVAPNAAGGLLITAAGSLDMDDIGADVDAIETRVTTALPNAAPQAAGGLITSIAGSFDIDEMNVDVEAIQTQTDKLTFTVTNQIDANVLDWKSATAPAMTGDAFARLGAPSGASISVDLQEANADLDELITTIGVAGAGLTAIPDSAAVTEIGDDVDELIVTIGVAGVGLTNLGDSRIANLDATVSSRNSTSHFDTIIGAPVSASISDDIAAVSGLIQFVFTAFSTALTTITTAVGLVKLKTDNLPASPAATSDIPTATTNADTLLNRDMSAVTDSNDRTLLNAIRFLRNKWAIAGATLTVKKEDDATTAWTATVSSDAGAIPIIGNDPA